MMSITSDGTDITIRVRGGFDDQAVARACTIISDFVGQGGMVTDVVLDLSATGSCSTSALRQITSLLGGGMRLSDVQHARRVRRGRPRHDGEQRRALPS